jgi:hypothetical protein
VAAITTWFYPAVRIQHPKRVGFGLFLSLHQKRRGGLVENIGKTLAWSPINFFADLPLLHGDFLVDPSDKEELCDHSSLKSTTQLVHGHVQSDLNDEHVFSSCSLS